MTRANENSTVSAAGNPIPDSDVFYRLHFEQSAEALLIIENNVFIECNQAAVQILAAKDKGALLAVHPAQISPEKQPDGKFSSEKVDEMIQIATKKGKHTFEWVHRRLNGEDFLVEVSLSPFTVGNRHLIYTILRDISERKKADEKRRRFELMAQNSTEIAQEIAAATKLEELFENVVTLTKERLGYYHTQLLRYDPAQDAVVLISGYGETGAKMLADGHKMAMGRGLIGTAAATGETVMRSNLADVPGWQPNPLLPKTKGEIAVPIKLGEQVLGVLDAQSDTTGAITEDDRLLLDGLCGQIAIAIEQTRLRSEMAERLAEVNRLYQAMSREGWKAYRETKSLPSGFIFDQIETRPLEENTSIPETTIKLPIKVLGGDVIGELLVADNPESPLSQEDIAFIQQVSDQIALAMESARLTAQTQSALAQTERLSQASLQLTRANNLQELLEITVKTIEISSINRAVICSLAYTPEGKLKDMTVIANWWNGKGQKPTDVGTKYAKENLEAMSLFLSPTPLYSNDALNDERIEEASKMIAQAKNIRAIACLPLYTGEAQTGLILLEGEEPHEFSEDETRLFNAMGPQIATVLENRRQFERAQRQAEREATLNAISQKIQSATSVEAVLQIAARELGHALGAPRAIAQLSLKDK